MCIYVAKEYDTVVADMRLAGAVAMFVLICCSGRPVGSVRPVYRTPLESPAAFFADWEACLLSSPSNFEVVGDLR